MAQEPAADQYSLTGDGCYVALTEGPLDVATIMQRVRSPKAGANVLFAGCGPFFHGPSSPCLADPEIPGSTRDSFEDRPVATLRYAAYRPLALRTMLTIASDVREAHNLVAIAVVHRLGPVPIGEDSILIAVSAPHREATWRAGEACLERVKERAEIWKEEVFVAEKARGRGQTEGESVWRANRDPRAAAPVALDTAQPQEQKDT